MAVVLFICLLCNSATTKVIQFWLQTKHIRYTCRKLLLYLLYYVCILEKRRYLTNRYWTDLFIASRSLLETMLHDASKGLELLIALSHLHNTTGVIVSISWAWAFLLLLHLLFPLVCIYFFSFSFFSSFFAIFGVLSVPLHRRGLSPLSLFIIIKPTKSLPLGSVVRGNRVYAGFVILKVRSQCMYVRHSL